MRAVAFAVWICALAPGQQTLRSRLQPITAPVRHAGVYHVATGTWTRHASLANVIGPDIIYNNSCAPVYFVAQQSGEKFQHRSRLPSTTGPTTMSVFYGTTRTDEAPGCYDAYTVNGFQIGYCSSAVHTVDFLQEFASSYVLCDTADMIAEYAVALTGLPGGSATGTQRCWTVDVDLSNMTPPMVLSADGDGTYVGPSSQETFGWSTGPTGGTVLADGTGPLVAGDFTWTGGSVSGVMTPCSGTDGTIWDNPISLVEEGTGMSSLDFFRDTGLSANAPGCYQLPTNLQSDFYLVLFAFVSCPKTGTPQEFCFPGENGTRACTTCVPANPPSAHGRGCNNYGQVTGGAHITSVGSTQVSHDTLVFTASFENHTAFTVLMQGTTTTNVPFGAGIRCVSGNLKRLYTGPAGSAANGDPPGAFHRPGPVDMRRVHQASFDVGYDIGAHAPVTLFYMTYYRDPSASAHCNGATFNASQGVGANWIP
jgi:hypothetical protein